MVAFQIIVRIVLTASTLFSLLGPTFADAVAREEVPAPPETEQSEPDERDLRKRPSRRERRAADHLAGPDTAGAGAAASRDGLDIDHPASQRRDEPVPDGEQAIGHLDPDAPVDPALLPPSARDGAAMGQMVVPSDGGAAATTGLNGPDGFKGAPGCTLQCITSGVAYARGVNARLVVKTDTPAWITLSVHGAKPNSYHTSSEHSLKTSFAVDLQDLQPGTTYDVLATARDSAGKTSYAVGSFTTLRRVAEVNFHLNWEVTKTPYDKSYHHHYRVNGAWQTALSTQSPYAWPLPALPNPVVVEDAPAELDLAAQVVTVGKKVDDAPCGNAPVGPFGGNAPGHPFGWSATTIDGACVQIAWGTAIPNCLNPISLDARPADATSWTHHQLSLTLRTDVCYEQFVDFAVPLTVDVSYVP